MKTIHDASKQPPLPQETDVAMHVDDKDVNTSWQPSLLGSLRSGDVTPHTPQQSPSSMRDAAWSQRRNPALGLSALFMVCAHIDGSGEMSYFKFLAERRKEPDTTSAGVVPVRGATTHLNML